MVFNSVTLKFNGLLPCLCFLLQFSCNYVEVIFLLISFMMLTATCSSRLLLPSADNIGRFSCKVRFTFASEAIFKSKFVFLASKSKGDQRTLNLLFSLVWSKSLTSQVQPFLWVDIDKLMHLHLSKFNGLSSLSWTRSLNSFLHCNVSLPSRLVFSEWSWMSLNGSVMFKAMADSQLLWVILIEHFIFLFNKFENDRSYLTISMLIMLSICVLEMFMLMKRQLCKYFFWMKMTDKSILLWCYQHDWTSYFL